MERGGGVAVESDGAPAVGAGLIPLAAFLPRAMFNMIVMGRREKWREQRRGGRGEKLGKGERVTNQKREIRYHPPVRTSSRPSRATPDHCAHLVSSSRAIRKPH
jgi:hypothetical protein